jgi:hypothetical protein
MISVPRGSSGPAAACLAASSSYTTIQHLVPRDTLSPQVTRTIRTNYFQMNQRAYPRKKLDAQVNESMHKPQPDAIDTTVRVPA